GGDGRLFIRQLALGNGAVQLELPLSRHAPKVRILLRTSAQRRLDFVEQRAVEVDRKLRSCDQSSRGQVGPWMKQGMLRRLASKLEGALIGVLHLVDALPLFLGVARDAVNHRFPLDR